MQRFRLALIVAAIAVLALAGGAALPRAARAQSAWPQAPGQALGGLDLDSYCQSRGYSASEVLGPIVGPGAAFRWVCTASGRPNLALGWFTMIEACRAAYPRHGLVLAWPQDPNNAYSWVCFTPGRSGGTGQRG